MPKECLSCQFVSTDDALSVCPRCHSQKLRFSVLAGLKLKTGADQQQEVKVAKGRRSDEPSWGETAFAYLLWLHAAATIVLGVSLFGLADEGLTKGRPPKAWVETLAQDEPKLALLTVLAGTLFAALAAAVFTLRGIGLAQQRAIAFAVPGSALLLAEAHLGGLPTPPWAWAALPAVAGTLAFLAGLRLAVRLRTKDEADKDIEFKPIDSWDREAKARTTEAPIPPGRRIARMQWGIIAGMISPYILHFILTMCSGGNPGPRFELAPHHVSILRGFGAFVAGVVAASSTRHAFSQGMFAGLGVLLGNALIVAFFADGQGSIAKALWNPRWLPALPLHLVCGYLGGLLGRYGLAPQKFFRGKRIDAQDAPVYVGDELPVR